MTVCSSEIPKFPHFENDERLRECDSVALAALENLGKQYRITRELHPDFVDCSTVVSQSHWVGAGIQTPFIAESQRKASNACVVGRDDLLPGDAIYAYASKELSPGGRHNHTVLFLGHDQDGAPWAIESREEHGARLITMDAVAFDGGIRRFCLNPLSIFPAGQWSDLVRAVPKLGRLGARLTSRYGSGTRHRGLDIYARGEPVLVSPLAGSIVEITRVSAGVLFAGIWCQDSSVYTLVGPMAPSDVVRIGRDVVQGEILGAGVEGSGPGGCNMIPGAGRGRVHWELWALPEFGVSPAPDLRCEWIPRLIASEERLIAQNPIYALKLGKIGSCLAPLPE
jgi:hypothetical protein